MRRVPDLGTNKKKRPAACPIRARCGASCLFGNGFDIGVHARRALLLHLLGHMAVNIECKGCRGVAKIALHGLDIVAGADRGHGVGVPLRYNNDKPEKPRNFKG